jgi:predicted ATPase
VQASGRCPRVPCARETISAVTETRLLERGPELDILAGVAASASAGRGRAVLIEGEAGAGKSALLDAIAAAHVGAEVVA